MTPLRLAIHIKKMAGKETVETPSTIKTMLNNYSTSANADKEWDIKWYAEQMTKVIDELIVQGWGNGPIKEQILGRLSSIIPDA
jgi:hypothetical protein